MQHIDSSVGIITTMASDELSSKAKQIGAVILSDIQNVTENFNLLVFDLEPESLDQIKIWLREIKQSYHNLNICILVGDVKSTDLFGICSNFNIDKIVKKNEIPILEHLLYESLESYNQKKQFTDYEKLINEQNNKLQELKQNLEERIKRRQTHLEKLNKKLMQTQQKTKILNSCLLNIYQSKNFHDIETRTARSLKPFIKLEWIRISLDMLNEFVGKFESQHSLYTIELELSKHPAHVYFAKTSEEEFSTDEMQLLQQLIEPLTIAVDRLIKLEQTETLRYQWESTFDAISEPICLTDDDFEIIKTNKAFQELLIRHKKSKNNLILNKEFWSRDLPNIDQMKVNNLHTFQIQDNDEIYIYEVIKQKLEININDTNKDSFIFLYRDITADKRMERQLLESSKMKELGTIGSSMAHELNNPLGGILSFIQLIEMDLEENSPIKDDILEMKSAALRCKDLIDHLLGFSRRQDLSDSEHFDLNHSLNNAIKLFEAKSKNLGIFIDLAFEPEPMQIYGNENQVTQALTNVIQNSVESLEQCIQDDPQFDAHIRITSRCYKNNFEVVITDNGKGISEKQIHKVFNPLFTTKNPNNHSGLGLTIAFQVAQSHHGILEIFSQPMAGTSVKFSFERLDLPSKKPFQT